MERFRRKKSKATPNNEGSQEIHKRRSIPILASGFSYMKEYSAACELDGSSSRQISGLPMKKLLAEEMSNETESKRRSPSVVARLMGLDGMPTQQPIHRQYKTSKERTTFGIAEIRRTAYECQSYMNSSRENPEFKDVYEISKEKESVKPKQSEVEANFIQQKFMDANRFSVADKFQNKQEFSDTFHALDANKNLLIKCLQQPDSLYTKHLRDLQGASPMPHRSRVQPVSKECENKTIDLKSKEGTSHCKSRYRREHLRSLSPNSGSPCSSNRSPKSSEIPLGRKHETEILPTRIVVLKPHLEKLQNAKKPDSSCRRHAEYPSNISEGTGRLSVKPLPDDLGFSRPNVRKSRERAKLISRRMRKNLVNDQIDLLSYFQGYAGDESSYGVSAGDSGSELEEHMFSSRKSFHSINQWNFTSSYLHESSISREAKKRLSKRLNASQRYQDFGSGCQISKVSDMLAKPDREMRQDKFDPELIPDMSMDRVFVKDIMGLGSHSGISCRDDWKDRYARNLSKSRFVSDSVSCYNPESSTQSRKHNQSRRPILKEPANQERNNATNENVMKRDGSPFRNPRSGNQNQSRYNSGDCANIVEKDQYDIEVGQNIPPEEVPLVSKMSGSNDHGTRLVAEVRLGIEHGSKHFSCGSTDEFSVKPSPCLSWINNSSVPGSKDSEQQIEPCEENLVPLQCPVHKIQSSISSEEVDHPSPVSVLEVPLTEDISSGSECFEKVGADLHELRMQLKLLRMESGGDGNNLVSSDRDDSQDYSSEIGENATVDWQTSYINNVLEESGFDSIDPNMIIALWHSLECPIGPWVFDKLEKKYCKDEARSKSDRRLLFDRINGGIAWIFWWLVDSYPWVESGRKKFGYEWAKNGIRHELGKLLTSEGNQTLERVLDQEMEWLDFEDEIDVIGRELENLLVNDLIDEVASLKAL